MKHLKSYTLFERVSKETKLFESLNNSDFLVEEEIKELFYELTDDEEMSQCKIDNFGYRFFSTDFITRSIRSQLLYDMSFTDDWINKECKEVQDTWKNLFIDLSEPRPNNIISLAKRNDEGVYSDDRSHQGEFNSLVSKNILNGNIPAYKMVVLNLGGFKPEKLPIVIECLQRLYDVSGFRPTSYIWDEDYADEDSGDIVTYRKGILKLYKVNDVEYSNLCKIDVEGKLNKEIIKYFL
jgi:hypothetical protein